MPRVKILDSMAEAVADFPDGASLFVPGFGPGYPWNLLTALYHQGAKDLTIITNGLGARTDDDHRRSANDFVYDGRVKMVKAAFTAATRPSNPSTSEQLVRDGKLDVELMPQGTLAERIRAAGAGIPAFYTPASVGTLLAEPKEKRVFDGREYVMEYALPADYAFIRAWKADTAGNLLYRFAARNFNPIMATAAKRVIVEVEQPIVEAGELPADSIHTPGVYVDALVKIPDDGIFAVDRRKERPLR